MPVALRSLLTVLVLLLGGVAQAAADCHHHDQAPAANPTPVPVALDALLCDHGYCGGACGHPRCPMLASADVAAEALPPVPELRAAALPAAASLVPAARRVATASRAWPPPLIHLDHPAHKARVLRL